MIVSRMKRHRPSQNFNRLRKFFAKRADNIKNHYPLCVEALEVRQMLDSETFSDVLVRTPTNFNEILTIPQFDTFGGLRTLDQVDIFARTTMQTQTSGSLQNTGNSAATYRAVVDGTTAVSGTGLTGFTSTVHTDTGTINVPAFTTVNIDPPVFDDDPVNEIHSYLDAPTLALFTGVGNLNYTYLGDAAASVTVGGGGNLIQNVTIETSSIGSLRVTYTFHFNEFDRISISADGVNEVGQSHIFTALLEHDDGRPANQFGGDAFDGFAPAAGQSVEVRLNGTNGAIPDISAPTNQAPANPSSETGLTDASGLFAVTFSSASAGKVIGNAYFGTVVDTDPSTAGVPSDTSPANVINGPSTKRFVDANITIAPDGQNPVGAPHTFTVTVQQDDGLLAAEGGDGVTGFAPVSGAAVTVGLVGTLGAIPDIIAPTDQPPANPSSESGPTNASGQFAVTFTSAIAGTVTGNGEVIFTLDGVNLVRDTNPATAAIGAGPGGSGPAVKTFIPTGGHTATIGFWHNKNGRAVILSSPGNDLSNWLSTNFPNLYGSLAGATDLQVYNFFISGTNSYFGSKGTKTNAQVLATAFAVYFSDVSNTATAQQFGFDAPIGGTIVSVNGNASAFAGFLEPGGTTISINNMLAAANFNAVGGVIFGGSGSNWKKVNDQFSFVNETFDIP